MMRGMHKGTESPTMPTRAERSASFATSALD